MDASGELLRLAPVDTTTLQVRVYELLRDTLLDGQLRPGEVLSIRALASALGTSVMPVREAIGRLQAEGAVEIRLPGRQICVPIMSRQSVAELYRVRIQLEGMAAAMAAEHVTAADLEQIAGCITAMKLAEAVGDGDQFLRKNRAFHFATYRVARSHHLMPIIESLWLKFGPLLRVPFGPVTRAEDRVTSGGQQHHEDVLLALRANDATAAARAIRGDLSETAEWFAKHYDPDACVSPAS